MISAVHLLRCSRDAAANRAFFRDVLGWPFVDGRVTSFRLPGGGEVALYQPSHETAYDL